MERAVCEQCGHWQPGDWAAGDLCIACGAAVRREVRCAWCAEWVPAAKFCRTCGCDVLGPEQYGAARMLKSAGVDRFSLAQRLRDLDPEQAVNLGRIYNAQLAVVLRRVEEVRLCERFLLQKIFSKHLEEELVPRLPLEKEGLAELAAGPVGPFDRTPELLVEIAAGSPIPTNRTLASIALFRRGHFEGTYAAVGAALYSDDNELALEAAFAIANWRARLYPHGLWRSVSHYSWASRAGGIDARRLADVASAVPSGSMLRPWAAAALAIAWHGEYNAVPEHESGEERGLEWLRTELQAGLSSRDPDLRFTCAIALGADEAVARALESRDEQQRTAARRCLAKHKSLRVAPLLTEGPDEIRAEILEYLWTPLPGALIDPVLHATERAAPEARHTGVRLLLPGLTERIVERLTRLARRERDPEVLKLLLGCERLPEANQVLHAVFDTGLFEGVRGILYDTPEQVDFSDAAVFKFASKSDEVVLENLINIADRQLDKLAWDARAAGVGRGKGVALFLVRVAFGSFPPGVRCRAYGVLDHYEGRRWNWLSKAGIRELFGDESSFLKEAIPVMATPGLEAMCGGLLEKLAGSWAEIGDLLAHDQSSLKKFIEALQQLASGRAHSDLRCREGGVRLLTIIATSLPKLALPAAAALLREEGSKWDYRDVPANLLAGYSELARQIGRETQLAAGLADALIRLMRETTLEYRYIPAIELLTCLARDYPAVMKNIAAQCVPILKDRELGDRMLKPALDGLAGAVGYDDKESKEKQKDEVEAPPPALDLLDHLPILPDQPLKTLAEYTDFLKAMGQATDPLMTMAKYGLTVDSYGECVERWGEVISTNDQIAIRYGQLLAK